MSPTRPAAKATSEERNSARLNRTVAALMQRGLDSTMALKLRQQGETLASLKGCSAEQLESFGLNSQQAASIHAGNRSEIPFDNLARVLWACRWTCCVCRAPNQAVILHHIQPWAKTRDHRETNLVVLCLEHHAQAHRRGDLERNLDAPLLVDHKARWEREVAHRDAHAVLDASVTPSHHWMWFNHVRLLDLARQLGIEPTKMLSFLVALNHGYVDADGLPKRNQRHFVASGGDGNWLLDYLRNLLNQVLARSPLFNISDDLDRSLLGRVVRPGHLILVQGRHVFTTLNKRIIHGPGQAVDVRRRANGVEVSFTIDRWEAVATSSWGAWLKGTQSVASIVRVLDVEATPERLNIRATGLAVGLTLQGLALRSYAGFDFDILGERDPGFDPLAWLHD